MIRSKGNKHVYYFKDRVNSKSQVLFFLNINSINGIWHTRMPFDSETSIKFFKVE